MLKIYLDTCSLQRPFDSKEQVRNALEAEAVLFLISLHDTESINLVSSEALLFENQRVADPARQEFALAVLRQAKIFVQATNAVQSRARNMIASGVMPLDALHLASAQEAQADYFCTCDDKLLKKAKPLCEPSMRVLSPVQLLQEIEDES
ncbi:MAG: PIN domain-containing protein [Acidobacteriota bacterium]|nr:PIN domain-containing protein [Acidobacteriota bacterium]